MSSGTVRFSAYRTPTARDLQTLTVRSLGHFIYSPPIACIRPNGWHVDILMYTVAGSAMGTIGGIASTAQAGSLWFHPKDKPYEFAIDAKMGFWEGRWIEIDGACYRPLLAKLGLDAVTHVPASGAASPIEDLFDRFAQDAETADNEAGALIWQTLLCAQRASANMRKDAELTLVERVRRYVRDNLPRDFELAELAEQAQLSQFHFSRLFKQLTGSSPMAYVRSARIARAQELLLEGTDIKRIAREVGYGSAAHLSTAFAREVGCSPRAFRKRVLDLGAS
jgi:AraC-like DNA-binding protein